MLFVFHRSYLEFTDFYNFNGRYMIRQIYIYGAECLRKVCSPVTDFSLVRELIGDLFETMRNAEGVGLSAPQIGVSLRVFVIDPTPLVDPSSKEYEKLKQYTGAFINPVIIQKSKKVWEYEEGCLSIPSIRIPVIRPYSIVVEYTDENLNRVRKTLSGIVARIFLHENDHLDGILITDYLTNGKVKIPSARKREIMKKLKEIESGKVETSYPISL